MPKRRYASPSGNAMVKRTYGNKYPVGRSRAGRQSTKNRSWPFQNDRSYLTMFDPFPARMRTRLRYSTVVTLDPSTATPSSHLFRANSIFDPDFTSIGHQPYGHDTWQLIYNHYNVLSSKIVVQVTKGVDGIYGIAKTDDSTVQADFDTIREQKGCNCTATASGATAGSVTNYYSQKYFTKDSHSSDKAAQFGANPTEQMYYQVFYEAENNTTDPSARSFLVNIVYDVEMWELKDLGQS